MEHVRLRVNRSLRLSISLRRLAAVAVAAGPSLGEEMREELALAHPVSPTEALRYKCKPSKRMGAWSEVLRTDLTCGHM